MKTKNFSAEATLGEAREWLSENVDEGALCPCCNQHAKIYTRKLNAGMARTLIWIVQNTGPEQWIDMSRAPKFIHKNREHGKLTHWGLLEAKPNEDGTKKDSGVWRATPSGRTFVQGVVSARSHVHLYDNEALGFADTKVTIQDALGEKFDFQELMSARRDADLQRS